jgi:hypothetical protein
MTAKRLLITLALVAIAVSTGCRSYCEHAYPCQQYAPPQACSPCCCPAGTGGTYVPPVPPAPPAPATTTSGQRWNDPRGNGCTCPCN